MSARIPPEFKSQTPGRLREYAQQHAAKLPAAVQQALLDAANEIEGGEYAFAVVVDEKRALQRKLTQTESNLRGAYDMIARQHV